jgi:hypothetical protein
MNGTIAKVEQPDVKEFLKECTSTQDIDRLKHFIRVLILSRWCWFALVEKQHGLQMAQRAQFCLESLDTSLFSRLLLASPDSLRLIEATLATDFPLFGVGIDEANALLERNKVFPSSDGSKKRCLGAGIVEVAGSMNLRIVLSGTALRLDNFSSFASNTGAQAGNSARSYSPFFMYDFLGADCAGEQQPLAQVVEGAEKHVHFVPNGVSTFMNMFIDWDSVNPSLKGDIVSTLQGRPRFVASFVAELLMHTDSTLLDTALRSCLDDYHTRMVSRDERYSLYREWSELINSVAVCSSPTRLWRDIGMDLLQHALYSEGDENTLTFPELEFAELMTRGICMMVKSPSSDGFASRLVEPMVIEAGLTFGAASGTMMECLVSRLVNRDPAITAQMRGKLLETIVAFWLYSLRDTPCSNVFPNRTDSFPKFRGIRVDRAISDDCKDWVLMPENIAGPDIIALPAYCSVKWSDSGQISSDETNKSIRTSDPEQCYFAKDAEPKAGTQSAAKREAALPLLRTLSGGLCRVRIELPQPAPMSKGGTKGGDWEDGLLINDEMFLSTVLSSKESKRMYKEFRQTLGLSANFKRREAEKK